MKGKAMWRQDVFVLPPHLPAVWAFGHLGQFLKGEAMLVGSC